MNARDFIFGVGAALFFVLISASLYLQYRGLETSSRPQITAAIETLEKEIAGLKNIALDVSTNTENDARFVAAVEAVVKPLNDRIAALNRRLDDADLVRKADLEALTQIAQANQADVEAIVSGERSDQFFGNMNAKAAVSNVAARNGYLRVLNYYGTHDERLRVGSVTYRVPYGSSGIVVPAGTVISTVSGLRHWDMPEGGLTLEYYRGGFHPL